MTAWNWVRRYPVVADAWPAWAAGRELVHQPRAAVPVRTAVAEPDLVG